MKLLHAYRCSVPLGLVLLHACMPFYLSMHAHVSSCRTMHVHANPHVIIMHVTRGGFLLAGRQACAPKEGLSALNAHAVS